MIALLIGQLAKRPSTSYFREADDCVQRGPQLVGHVGEEFRLHPARLFELAVFFLEPRLEQLQLGDVTRRRKHALQYPVAVVESARVVRHHGEGAIPGPRCQLVVGDFAFGQHLNDRRLRAAWSVKILEGAPMSSSRCTLQSSNLLVDVF